MFSSLLTSSLSSIVCGDRKVKQAYYHVCQDCSKENGVCSKCGKTEEITERWGFTCKKKHGMTLALLCVVTYPLEKKEERKG